MSHVILVRYGELALKSPPVRREFELALKRNILRQFEFAGLSCRLKSDRGHLYVEAADAGLAVRLLCRVFGITSVSEVWPVATSADGIRERVLEVAEPVLGSGQSFAIRARRTGTHPFTSQELARDLGAAVLERYASRQPRVDLGHPDVEITVEVRDNLTYVSVDRAAGPGGIPLGVAGHVVALVDGHRGALGAWMMMKRGCRASVVAVGTEGERDCRSLGRFDPRLESVVATPSGASAGEEELARLAEARRADAVVLPISVDEYVSARSRWGERVVFSPTVGLLDEEVEERWRGVLELAA